MANPASDLRTDIVAGGLTNIGASNVFIGLLRGVGTSVPANSLFIAGDAGNVPSRFMGQVTEVRHPVVHIRIRWGTFGGGDTIIRVLQDFLQAVTIAGYLDVVAMQSEPVPLGSDNSGNFLWIMSYRMVYEDAA